MWYSRVVSEYPGFDSPQTQEKWYFWHCPYPVYSWFSAGLWWASCVVQVSNPGSRIQKYWRSSQKIKNMPVGVSGSYRTHICIQYRYGEHILKYPNNIVPLQPCTIYWPFYTWYVWTQSKNRVSLDFQTVYSHVLCSSVFFCFGH